ncbi:elongator complex protein 5-like [Mizuhopecten yessoensis]|uniref:Elongator complex protein 5 n=1 Tax=Mizuhopecten yessoensis TaxID=6573 RepID=A0A210PL29_MIZYE|nr:elongator complex protein 5-like [Mizuhopecten yessoensis]OWF37191.1 Elongator complex protein 5 [Mizuhopecten yessoensis]
MLGDLVKGREKSTLTLIEDSVEEPGRGLLSCFLLSLCQRVDEVHVLTFDPKSQSMLDVVPAGTNTKIVHHNCQHDMLNWKESSELCLDSDLAKVIKAKGNLNRDRKVALVIDSLSALLLFRPVPYTCQTLHKLSDSDAMGASVEQVVALVHHDLHDNSSLTLVEHTVSTVIRTWPTQSPGHEFCCNTLHKKISGKIVRIKEHFNISDQFEIENITELKTVIDSTPQQPTSQVDPAANLTFNLSLTDQEKKARSQVKLPYTYDQKRIEATLNKSVGEGKIFYQPDEADDFDEEDPDDDLDV